VQITCPTTQQKAYKTKPARLQQGHQTRGEQARGVPGHQGDDERIEAAEPPAGNSARRPSSRSAMRVA